MLKKTITLLIAAQLLTTACGQSSGNSSTTLARLSTTAPAANSDGEIVTSIPASGAKVSASSLSSVSNDPLAKLTSVEIPAGALSSSAEVKIFETASLAGKVSADTFGLTSISKAGPSIVIESTATLSQPITVSVPYSSSGAKLMLAGQDLAVLVISGSSVELMSGDKIEIGLNTVDVKTNHFGAFQVINIEGSVQQATATVAASELKSVAEAAPAAEPAPAATPAATPAAEAPAIEPTPTPSATPTPTPSATPTPTPTPTPTSSPTPTLVGTWSTTCTDFESAGSTKEILIFTENQLVHHLNMYIGQGCTGDLDVENSFDFTYQITSQQIVSINNTNFNKLELSNGWTKFLQVTNTEITMAGYVMSTGDGYGSSECGNDVYCGYGSTATLAKQ